MKIIIAGSRDFNDFDKLCKACDYLLKNKKDIEIVSGDARGADRLGEKYAEKRSFKITKFPADWDKFGKSAGYIRNKEMAKYSDALIAFWNKKSKGTEHMINLAKEHGLIIRIFYYD